MSSNPNSLGRYWLVAVFFVLSLLCKPMAVTLPFVLLLLDYWPLENGSARGRRPAPGQHPFKRRGIGRQFSVV